MNMGWRVRGSGMGGGGGKFRGMGSGDSHEKMAEMIKELNDHA